MRTLYDFVTHIKIVEYLIAISCIALYIFYWEALKPKPFKTVADTAKDDLNHVRETGGTLKTIGKVAAAPFVGLAYVAIPFGNFVLKNAVVPERIPRQATDLSMILMCIISIMCKDNIGIYPCF